MEKDSGKSPLTSPLRCALHSNHKQVLTVAMPSNLILPSNVNLHVQAPGNRKENAHSQE